MQTAQSWHGNNFALRFWIRFHLASCRRLLCQSEMSPIFMVVIDVLVQEALQMALIQHDHVVEQVTAAVADKALRDSVLPWAQQTRSLGLNTEALDRINHILIEVRAAIEYEIARRGVVRKRIPQLLDYPRTRRMSGHVEM